VADVDLPVEAIALSVHEGIAMHPMKEFDPPKPAMMHDRLSDRTFEWKPAKCRRTLRSTPKRSDRMSSKWDGLLLDGWLPLGAQPLISSPRSG